MKRIFFSFAIYFFSLTLFAQTKIESDLPRIDMMEMMQADRLTFGQGENNEILWIFDNEPYTGFVYGEQRGSRIEGEFRNGLEHGSHKEWYDNNQIKNHRIYEDGVKVSTREWDKEGNLIKELNHIDE